MEKYYQIVDWNEKKSIRLNIDIEEWDKIFKYLKSNPQINKEYIEISQILLRNLVNTDKYRSIQTSEKLKDYYEMIFTGSGRNDSILCKEYHNKEHRDIILIEVFELRKGESNISRMVNRILEIGGFDYDVE